MKLKIFFASLALSLVFVMFSLQAFATSTTCQDITGTANTSVLGQLGANIGELFFGPTGDQLPPLAAEACITKTDIVTDTGEYDLKGWVWSNNIGWVKFDWCNDGVWQGGGTCDKSKQTKVTKEGLIKGYAWNDVAGWIKFDWWDGMGGVTDDMKPKIEIAKDKFGELKGYFWSGNLGFALLNGARTDWRPQEIKIVITQIDPNNPVIKSCTPSEENCSVLPVIASIGINKIGDPFKLSLDLKKNGVPVEVIEGDIKLVWNDTLCSDQVNSTDCDTAVKDDLRKGSGVTASLGKIEVTVNAWVPTSSGNGYDSDGDGKIDFFYDKSQETKKDEFHLILEKIVVPFKEDGKIKTQELLMNYKFDYEPLLKVTEVGLVKKVLDKWKIDLVTPSIQAGRGEEIMLGAEGVYDLKDVDTGEDYTIDFDWTGTPLATEKLKWTDKSMATTDEQSFDSFADIALNEGAQVYSGVLSLKDGEKEIGVKSMDLGIQSIIEYKSLFLGRKVKYYSNKFPRGKKSIFVNPSAVVSGTVSSTTGVKNIQESDTVKIRPIGNVTTSVLQEAVFRNVSALTRGVNIQGVQPITIDTSFGKSSGAAVYLKNKKIIYAKGDVTLKGLLDKNLTEDKLLIVDGGNVYLTGDVLMEDNRLEIVVIKEGVKGGNLYVKSTVKDLYANIYLDGSLLSYASGTPTGVPVFADRRSLLSTHQLYFWGSIASKNTIGGAEEINGKYLNGVGEKVTKEIAEAYDLNFLRYPAYTFELGVDGKIKEDIMTGDYIRNMLAGYKYSKFFLDAKTLLVDKTIDFALEPVHLVYRSPRTSSEIFKQAIGLPGSKQVR